MSKQSFSEQVKEELKRKSFTSADKEGNIVEAEDEDFLRENAGKYLTEQFLKNGSMSDPAKASHLEFACEDDETAKKLREALLVFEIKSGTTGRNGRKVVYIKDGSDIVTLLGGMGAHVALMETENRRILREMRGTVNRRVNCDAANIAKAVRASGEQTEAIRYLESRGALKKMDASLKEAARMRLEYPEMSLKELAGMMKPPLTKSGLNHRLQKLVQAATKLKDEEESGG